MKPHTRWPQQKSCCCRRVTDERVRKISSPTRFDPKTVQPVASYCREDRFSSSGQVTCQKNCPPLTHAVVNKEVIWTFNTANVTIRTACVHAAKCICSFRPVNKTMTVPANIGVIRNKDVVCFQGRNNRLLTKYHQNSFALEWLTRQKGYNMEEEIKIRIHAVC